MNKDLTLSNIISFCKENGFVFQSSEIYGGFAAVYDYGPNGVELANNIKKHWWKAMVHERVDSVGIDSSIFMAPRIWEASGHVGGFADPLVECRDCNTRSRADHLLEEIGVAADDKMSIEDIASLFSANEEKLSCPSCGAKNFTEPRQFNLLVSSNLGNITSDAQADPVWLRGETCQGIYVNYLNVMKSMRMRPPFAIGQIGKAFRNEVTTGQFVFRTREFEQMEYQKFVHPDAVAEEYAQLKEDRMKFYIERLGLREENLRWRQHDQLAFYASDAWDIEYRFPWGFGELEGLHARGCHDLTQHTEFSGKNLAYKDPVSGEEYIPHIVEASSGVGRAFMAVLCESLLEEELDDGKSRTVLQTSPSLSPVKVAVFPLKRNNEELVGEAKKIFASLAAQFPTNWDDNGNVGKRYRRQDIIGTPFTVTVDFTTLEEGSVTVRDRDSREQVRVSVDELVAYIQKQMAG